ITGVTFRLWYTFWYTDKYLYLILYLKTIDYVIVSTLLSETLLNEQGFLHLKPDEDENLRGQEVRLERSERTLRQQRPAGRATQWRVILYHRPNSETLLNKQGFFVSEA
ncbi:hypothetical protein JI616_000001, partial [Salmonella enterica]|nr:hypothetical protein [Salmonella enterica]